ncbi:DUF2312 domain-containing protein [Brevundimonas nasdae]|jgi:uncharacterized protein (UPF0335 family)|uniref:DUF2312 domain-containing protein n=1 Tax=Brevundimonas nasdae TaxID=172043 RepID=UPI003B1578FC
MNVGRNTAVGKELISIIERVESVMAAKQTMSDDIAAILAEAKFRGFVPKAIRHVIKVRAMKPHDRQESEAIISTYMHAIGEESEAPLFRHVNQMAVDIASRDQVAEAMKRFVPSNGSIIIEAGGKGVKLTRDGDGEVTSRDLATPWPDASGARPAAAPAPKRGSGSKSTEVPETDDVGAEALGREAFKANEPVIRNPFPFGDSRRGRWDAGWRAESGTDGMGPDNGDD